MGSTPFPGLMRVDRRLVALCGSERRLRVLAVLANASRPLTGYRVALIGEVPVSKVYGELRKLEKSGLVGLRGSSGWVLRDPDLGSFLRKRIRIVWWKDWFDRQERRERADRVFLGRLRAAARPRFSRDPGWAPRNPSLYRRDPRKDEALIEMGLRPSNHA